eukprot:5582423-Pleurochrysis_carterae.AAC.2
MIEGNRCAERAILPGEGQETSGLCFPWPIIVRWICASSRIRRGRMRASQSEQTRLRGGAEAAQRQ